MKKTRNGSMGMYAFELVDGDIYSLFSVHRCFDSFFFLPVSCAELDNACVLVSHDVL